MSQSPKFKGSRFEIQVSNALKALEGAVVLNNIKVFSHRFDKDTEIDRIVITTGGIYFIEAKGFNDKLSGDMADTLWVGWSGQYSHEIFNPFYQNMEHIRCFRNAMRRSGLKPLTIKNMVVVSDKCFIESNCESVYNLSECVRTIREEQSTKLYNLEEVIDSFKNTKLGR